jgi:hypothetical protein
MFPFSLLLPLIRLAIREPWFNCSKLWPSFGPENLDFEGQCALFPKYPLVIGNATVAVAYTHGWKTFSTASIDIVAPILLESFTRSIDIYGTFTVLPPEIAIILTGQDMGLKTAIVIRAEKGKQQTCKIATRKRWTDETVTNQNRTKQAIAHEMYHCVQGFSINNKSHKINWTNEGSAQYMSNIVFPNINMEWPGLEYSSNPALTIHQQIGRDKYVTALFF